MNTGRTRSQRIPRKEIQNQESCHSGKAPGFVQNYAAERLSDHKVEGSRRSTPVGMELVRNGAVCDVVEEPLGNCN